jgi:hypothetical protein
MKIWQNILIATILPGSTFAQQPTLQNISKPGFEHTQRPDGWAYNGSYFGEVMKYWFSATTASPDVAVECESPPSGQTKVWRSETARRQKHGRTYPVRLHQRQTALPRIYRNQLAEPLVRGRPT